MVGVVTADVSLCRGGTWESRYGAGQSRARGVNTGEGRAGSGHSGVCLCYVGISHLGGLQGKHRAELDVLHHGKLGEDLGPVHLHQAGEDFGPERDAGDVPQLVRKMEFIQETGEIVFVPSGWHHQVYNLEDTISINHNWFNGCNLMTVYEALKAELRKVEVELDDCRDDKDEWNAMCQGLLRATHGMNYIDFLDLVTNILHTRRDLVEGRLEAVSFDGRHLGPTHCLYDIGRIREVLLELNCDFTKLDMKIKVRECELLLQCCGSLLPG